MSCYKNGNIQKVYAGNRNISKIYKGSTLIFSNVFEKTFTASGSITLPNYLLALTVICIGAGGHGGGGGGLVMGGGTGGTGGLVTKVYTGSELSNLPQQIPINIGMCPDSKGADGQSTSFNNTVIAYGGGGGGEGGFGHSGSTGANGSGVGGDVTVGSPAADRTYDGIVYGEGGKGTKGGGNGYIGSQGCVHIIAEY